MIKLNLRSGHRYNLYMKVSFGKYKGRLIEKSNNKSMRPTTGIGKSVIFNSINIEGKRVLDLFAGTGSLGIEALSANAKWVGFSDINLNSINSIKKTLENFKIEKKKYEIYKSDFRMMMKRSNKIDIVFVDPPFSVKKYYVQFFKQIIKEDFLNKKGYLIIEKMSKLELIYPTNFEIIKIKRLGDNEIVILRKE